MTPEDVVSVRGSLGAKLVRTLLVVVVVVGIGTLSVVSYWSARTAETNLATISGHIEEHLDSKGRGLAVNHSLALKGMLQDNAFSDMEALINRTVDEDPDLVFGLLQDTRGKTLAYSARGVPPTDRSTKTPWTTLSLPEALPPVSDLQVTRLQTVRGETLEVAIPVLADKERVGTLRYGLSTGKMQAALDEARARARSDLLFTVFSLCGLVGLVGIGGVVMGRREAKRIVRPLQALTAAARALATGARDVRVDLHSGDELELLGNAFDQMAADLAASYASLEDLNRGLEQKVQERTQQLASRNQDMRVVLDNVTQGLITVDQAGKMAPEYSRAVEVWFGVPPTGVTLPDFMADRSQPFTDQLRLGIAQIQENFLPADLLLAQLPTRLTTAGREYLFTYKPIGSEDPIRGVLVVIEDITELLARQRDEREQREILEAVQHLGRDRVGFLSFLQEAERLLEEIRSAGQLLDQKRAIHTLKGSSALFGLAVVAAHCHILEQHIIEQGRHPLPAELANLNEHWSDLMKGLEPFLGGTRRETIEVPRTELEALILRLHGPNGAQYALESLTAWTLEPVRKPLERLAEQAHALAQRLGRGGVICILEADQTLLDAEAWAPFWSAMSHVVRNAVDHGLEPQDPSTAERPKPGKLTFRASSRGKRIEIGIADNGAGIPWEKLRQRAERQGIPATTRQDLVEALLTDGISTRLEVSEISGRGVGMAAVKRVVQQLGGTLAVDSNPGQGTTWTFTLPTELPRRIRPQADSAP